VTYSGQFIKVSWIFNVLGTDEVADTALNFTTAPGWTGAGAALTEIAGGSIGADVLGNMTTLLTALGWADYSTLVAVKFAAVGTDGSYVSEPYVYEAVSPPVGTQANTPPQLTLVASLRSGFTFGSGNYGRMYLPHTAPALESDTPYISASAASAIADYIKTFVNDTTSDINGVTTAVLFPAIMSNKGAGTGKGVTQVGAGRVIDTQRRRRNKLDDTATLVSL